MTFTLDNAVVFDLECFPNVFSLSFECLFNETSAVYELSQWRDDRRDLFEWLEWMRTTQTPMVSFNGIGYDYPLLHFLINNPQATPEQLRAKSDSMINSQDRFGHVIWDRDRYIPQIDLFKLHHFDNRAKTTSLKALQVNMRSPSVMDSPLPFDKPVAFEDVERYLIPYNKHDVKETKRFAHYSMSAIEFRIGLIEQFGIDVLNWSDVKIGEQILVKRIGNDVCFDYSSGRKVKRQTVRTRVALADVIFPYVQFSNPEFQRVLDYMRAQVLTPDDIVTVMNDGATAIETGDTIKTKGVFHGLAANVGGITFEFGTGGIHASVKNQRFAAGNGWLIRDIDVASLYPSIAIVNGLRPEHLGDAYTAAYASLPAERKEWQARKGKKCVEANTMKLGANGAYGMTNNKFSVLLDSQYTMTVTINGQLMIAMLCEWLATVPTVSFVQVNTDGVTYMIHEDYLPAAKAIEQQWQDYTKLVLEDVSYDRMFISDVNTYIAIDMDGKVKAKGRLSAPGTGEQYFIDVAEGQPPSWHRNLSALVCIRAAVAAMLHGIDPETFIRAHTEPFDFMLRARAPGVARLELDGVPQQSTLRYYIARDGGSLVKIAPPPAGSKVGDWKRAPRVTKADYDRRMAETGGEWCATVCTAGRTTYQEVRTGIEAGWRVAECNEAHRFDWSRVDYGYYVAEAKKLIIA